MDIGKVYIKIDFIFLLVFSFKVRIDFCGRFCALVQGRLKWGKQYAYPILNLK